LQSRLSQQQGRRVTDHLQALNEQQAQKLAHCPECQAPLNASQTIANLNQQLSELNQLVHTDTLTGLYNYRHFIRALEQELERTHRTAQPTSMIMLDLDFFKKVNDNWGHEVGNQALVQTAQLLRSTTRKLDIPCRYGGEEFALILPTTDLLTGARVAERIRAAIASSPLVFTDNQGQAQQIELNASLGVDVFSRRDSDTPEGFVARVDALLYQAKANGRNQVVNGVHTDMTSTATVTSDEKDALFGLFDE